MIDRPRVRQLGLGELLDESFRLYRNTFVVFVAIAALISIPYTIASTLLQIPMQQQLLDLQRGAAVGAAPFGSPDPWDFIGGFVFYMLGTFGLSILYVVFFQPLMEGALARAIAQRYLGQPVTLGDSFGTALRRIGALIGARLIPALIGFAIAGATIGVFVAIAFALISTTTNSDSGSSGALGAVGAVVCSFGLIAILVIASIFLTIRILFAPQVVVVEERGPWQSIVRSWNLSNGHFWRLFGYLFIVGLIVVLISIILSIVFVFPGQIVFSDDPVMQVLLSGVASAITSVFVTPFSMIAYTLLYFDLRVRKEGFDLEQQASALMPNQYPPYNAPSM